MSQKRREINSHCSCEIRNNRDRQTYFRMVDLHTNEVESCVNHVDLHGN
jgi:hypothetical protein